MSNWLSRAFARICGRPIPKAAQDLNRAAVNTNRKQATSAVRPAVQRRRSASGPSYGSRSRGSSDGGTYYTYDSGSYGGYGGGSCDSGGGSDGGGCGGGD